MKVWKDKITSRDKTFIRLKGIGLPSDGVCKHLFYSQRLFLSISHHFVVTVCSVEARHGNFKCWVIHL